MDLMFGVHQHLMVTSSRVQMEYLQMNEYLSLQTVIIDDSLQNTLGEKNAKCHLETFDFITYWYSYYS